jgi:hypothetical protein
MKALLYGIIVLLFFGFVFPQEIYDVKEVDIFNLEKLLSSNQISVNGVRIGDSLDGVLAKFKKTKKDINYTGKVYALDFDNDTWRILSVDNKTVQSILLFPNFKSSLKGKTAEYYDILSEGRLKLFIEDFLGEPDYIFSSDSEIMNLYKMFYIEKGFVFQRLMSDNSIILTTRDGVLSSIESSKSFSGKLLPKGKEIEEKLVPPKIISKSGFRGALWGASKEQVKKTETSEFSGEQKIGGGLKGLDVLTYKSDVSGLEAGIVYYFANNLLTRARYIFMADHSNANMYIDDYKRLKTELTNKYGAPGRDDTIWSNNLYKNDPSEYGMALKVGHLTYVAEWYPPESSIQMILRGDNFKISFWIEYTSEALKEFEKKVLNKAKKDIL